ITSIPIQVKTTVTSILLNHNFHFPTTNQPTTKKRPKCPPLSPTPFPHPLSLPTLSSSPRRPSLSLSKPLPLLPPPPPPPLSLLRSPPPPLWQRRRRRRKRPRRATRKPLSKGW
ncbi:hypothetical protein QBC45DRAFT_442018, partial [Copromyces sp. CBS 386.78]